MAEWSWARHRSMDLGQPSAALLNGIDKSEFHLTEVDFEAVVSNNPMYAQSAQKPDFYEAFEKEGCTKKQIALFDWKKVATWETCYETSREIVEIRNDGILLSGKGNL